MAARETTLEERAAFLDRAERFTPLVAVDSGGARYLLSTADRHIARALFMKSARGDMKLLPRAVKVLETTGNWKRDDGTLLEAGANVGTTTLTAVETQRFARVVACEPEPQNVFLLELNVVANAVEREVTVLPLAVGDSDDEVELLVSDRKSGIHEIHPQGVVAPSWEFSTVGVPQRRLDTLIAEIALDPDDVTLLWMDIQGHEGQALAGASELTRRGVPVVMELDPEALGRHGGLDLLRQVARDRYTHYVSMRRIRGGRELQFDLDPVAKLDEEIRWLVDHDRFTDILLLRDPSRRPQRGGLPLREKESRSPMIDKPGETAPAATTPSRVERRTFVRDARAYTPFVAAEVDGATFLLRTADAEAELFVTHSNEQLRALEQALAVLDEAGLGDVRRRAFLDLDAGTGIAATAAASLHGFASVVACAADLDAYTVLKLNLALNRLGSRARAVAAAPGYSDGPTVDALVRRGVLPADPGMVWTEEPNPLLTGAETLLEHRPPLVLRGGNADTTAERYGRVVELDVGRILLVP